MDKAITISAVVATVGMLLMPLGGDAVTKCFTVDSGGTLTTSLVSYYPMEGNSNDFFGTNNGSDSGVTYANSSGKVNQGGRYGGSASTTMSGVGIADPPFSVAFWMNTSSTGNIMQVVADQNDNTDGWMFAPWSDGNFYFFAVTKTSLGFPLSALTTSTWHFVVGRLASNGGAMDIWLDNVQKASTTSAYVTATKALAFAHSLTDANRVYTGNLDEVGIWSKVLTTTEMNDLYNAGAGDTMTSSCGGAAPLKMFFQWIW